MASYNGFYSMITLMKSWASSTMVLTLSGRLFRPSRAAVFAEKNQAMDSVLNTMRIAMIVASIAD